MQDHAGDSLGQRESGRVVGLGCVDAHGNAADRLVVIVDGPGLEGGGAEPPSSNIPGLRVDARVGTAPDSWALLELSTDIRPVEYVREHLQQIGALSPLRPAIHVDAIGRPAWLRTALEHEAVVETPASEALRLLGEAEFGA